MISLLRFFENALVQMPQCARGVISKKAQRIKKHPDRAVQAVGECGGGLVLPFSVKLHQIADHTIVRNMLDAVGIVTTDEIFVFLRAQDAVKYITSLARSIERDVSALQATLYLGDIYRIAVGAKERPHAKASGARSKNAVFFKRLFNFVGIFDAQERLPSFVLISFILSQRADFVNKNHKILYRRVNIRPFFSYPV